MVEENEPLDPPASLELQNRIRNGPEFGSAGLLIGRSQQTRTDADLKSPRPPLGPGITTPPQSPLVPPRLPGGTPPGVPGPGGPPTPPGTPQGDGGVAPVEIEPIFVDPIGWDDANLDQRPIRQGGVGAAVEPDGFIDYVIRVPLLATRPDPSNPGLLLPADRLTVTLSWLRTIIFDEISFASASDPRIGSVEALELEDLNLEIYLTDALGNIIGNEFDGTAVVRSSASTVNTTEHLSFEVPQDGIYLIRVRWITTTNDIFANQPAAEVRYGVAWRVDFSPRPAVFRPMGFKELAGALAGFGSEIGTDGYQLDGDADKDGAINFDDITTILANWER
ncbi:MAG TPA: hypothetical protein DEB06_07300 [Phycisphaerales bacterium]|nr:hypothetical protein [Phycisphaerales bacterium]